jgi:hypothetical protein
MSPVSGVVQIDNYSTSVHVGLDVEVILKQKLGVMFLGSNRSPKNHVQLHGFCRDKSE